MSIVKKEWSEGERLVVAPSSRGVIGTAWVSDRSVYGDRRNETRIRPEFVVRTLPLLNQERVVSANLRIEMLMYDAQGVGSAG